MRGKRLSLGLRATLAIFSVALLVTSAWAVSHEKVLYSFEGPPGYPATTYAGLISDAAGNLYGTSEQGGFGCEQWGCGTVFELSPNGSGGWTETVLYTFCMLWACAAQREHVASDLAQTAERDECQLPGAGRSRQKRSIWSPPGAAATARSSDA